MLTYEIIVDHGETANKCTIMPLAYRSDFLLRPMPSSKRLEAELLLHPQGESLAELGGSQEPIKGLALIDCVWRRLTPILDGIEGPLPRLVRIPPGFVTAYPRVSKKDFDPEGGLATIEALFIAAAFLGHWDQSLLREYFFAELFLDRNAAQFLHYGIDVAPVRPVYQPRFPKNARSRRLGRGRIPS